MKLKLFPKLLLAFLLTTAMLVVGMAVSVNWMFKQGLQDYLHHKEVQQLEKLIPVFENIYIEYGDWEILREQPFLLKKALRSVIKTRRSEPDRHRHSHRHKHDRPPYFFSIIPRLSLLDAEQSLIFGHRIAPVDKLYPLYQAEAVIGWVGVSRHRLLEDSVTRAFYSQQVRNYVLIALLALFLSALAAWLLVRQLLKPVKNITAGAKALAQGDYQTRIPSQSADELGQLSQDFNHLAQTLQENEQARRQWVADISHELRTPLAVLRGEIEAMQDGIREFSPQNLKSLHSESLNLSQLVEDLYELALSDVGALDYRRQPVDIAALLDDTINAFMPRFAHKQIDIQQQSQTLLFSADARRFSQLLSNLLENSLRYTDAGGQVKITLTSESQTLLLIVEDSAPCVPDTALPHLFERLYRVDKSRSRALGGAGLGLSICRNIVAAHQGQIEAKHSQLGGLALYMRFPRSGDSCQL